mgnify:CR=1 FL=1
MGAGKAFLSDLHTHTTASDGTRFSPNNTCTRGQRVTFLYRELGGQ